MGTARDTVVVVEFEDRVELDGVDDDGVRVIWECSCRMNAVTAPTVASHRREKIA